MDRLTLMRHLNPEFAEAERRGKKWALLRAEMARSSDGQASCRHPERTLEEDGKPRTRRAG